MSVDDAFVAARMAARPPPLLSTLLAAPGGQTVEGIHAGELARIRSAALRLPAAAHTVLTGQAQP